MKNNNFLLAACILATVVAGCWFMIGQEHTNISTTGLEKQRPPDQNNISFLGESNKESSTHKLKSNLEVHNVEHNSQVESNSSLKDLEPSECIVLTQSQSSEYDEIIINSNNVEIVTGLTIDEYLLDLDENQLVLEYKAGNAKAAFVLGANYQYRSHNSIWSNPFLGLEGSDFLGHPTPFNSELMEASREWFWAAAVGGSPMALLEIATTYSIESKLLKKDYSSGGIKMSAEKFAIRMKELKANELSYGMLFDEFATDISKFFNYDALTIKNEFSSLDMEDKQRIYDDVKARWLNLRLNQGRASKINFEVTPEIEHALNMLDAKCHN